MEKVGENVFWSFAFVCENFTTETFLQKMTNTIIFLAMYKNCKAESEINLNLNNAHLFSFNYRFQLLICTGA